ncbi:hypothetical protein EBU95_21460, partial [bacterium]|nr:hypothetical protein [bacterium]
MNQPHQICTILIIQKPYRLFLYAGRIILKFTGKIFQQNKITQVSKSKLFTFVVFVCNLNLMTNYNREYDGELGGIKTAESVD